MSKFMKMLNNISRSQAIYRHANIPAEDMHSGHYAFALAVSRNPGCSQEELARERICSNIDVQDSVSRSLGILRYARTITHDEALRLLSNVRLGIVSGQLKDVSLATIDKLMTDVEPATLTVNSGKSLTAAQRDTARADLLRKSLN